MFLLAPECDYFICVSALFHFRNWNGKMFVTVDVVLKCVTLYCAAYSINKKCFMKDSACLFSPHMVVLHGR